MSFLKNSTNSSLSDQDGYKVLGEIAAHLNKYYTIFIIIIGLIGNTITIVIFWRTKLTHTKKTSFYLISLAISDIGFLLILLFKYLDDEQILYTFSQHRIACKISVYLGYIFNFLSCSLIFTFTLQRLFVICFPLRVNFLNLERGSKILVILLFIFAGLFYGVTLYLFDIKIITNVDPKVNRTHFCTTKDGAHQDADKFNFLDSLFTLIIPFFGLLIMNAIIIRTLKKSSYNFIIRMSNNHFTYEPNNSLNFNHRNSDNFYKIQEGVSMGAGPVAEEINRNHNVHNRKKSMPKNFNYFQRSFKKRKEFDYYENESKNNIESVNGSIILSSYNKKQLKTKSNCFDCKTFTSKLKSNDAIFSTNLIGSNNSQTYVTNSHRPSTLMNSLRSNRKQSSVKIDNKNANGIKTGLESKKNSSESSSLLGKKNNFRARTSFRIGGSKTNSVSRKVTKMLIVVSSTFLVLNLPVHSINVYIAIRIFITGKNEIYDNEFNLREIFHSLFYTSFSCNFLLYSISGATFRTEFKRLVLNLLRIKAKTPR